jgi:hypothetical protein
MRQSVAAAGRRLGRVALAPIVALAGALAGLVYLVLLPICGIASIAGAAAQGAWAFVRDACALARGRAPRRS